MELTDIHLDLLWKMADVHYQCFEKFYKEYAITYQNVLELNHQKMLDISKGCIGCDEDMLTFIFEAMLEDYRKMLSRVDPRE